MRERMSVRRVDDAIIFRLLVFVVLCGGMKLILLLRPTDWTDQGHHHQSNIKIIT